MAHASTGEVEERESEVGGHPRLYRKFKVSPGYMRDPVFKKRGIYPVSVARMEPLCLGQLRTFPVSSFAETVCSFIPHPRTPTLPSELKSDLGTHVADANPCRDKMSQYPRHVCLFP